jgi:hypothetical protein
MGGRFPVHGIPPEDIYPLNYLREEV